MHNSQIFPDMFDDYVNLRPFKGVAEILAKDNTWGTLYDLEKLAKNEVKVTAATQVQFLLRCQEPKLTCSILFSYYEDM